MGGEGRERMGVGCRSWGLEGPWKDFGFPPRGVGAAKGFQQSGDVLQRTSNSVCPTRSASPRAGPGHAERVSEGDQGHVLAASLLPNGMHMLWLQISQEV